jgi:hypothetical protein
MKKKKFAKPDFSFPKVLRTGCVFSGHRRLPALKPNTSVTEKIFKSTNKRRKQKQF